MLPAELEGLDAIELGCGTGYVSDPFVPLEWARSWPCEEVWRARKRP
jgi:hypothetical protein